MLGFLQRLDETVLLWIHQGWRCGPADLFFTWITDIDHFIVPLAAVWILLLLVGGKRGRILALLLAVCLVMTDQLSGQVIKPWVGRERPCFGAVAGLTPLLQQVRSHSFPSSHASNVFGAATLLVLVYGWRWCLGFLLAGLVAASRVYVGVHYPSDTLGGAIVGIFCGWLIWRVARAVGLLGHGGSGSATGELGLKRPPAGCRTSARTPDHGGNVQAGRLRDRARQRLRVGLALLASVMALAGCAQDEAQLPVGEDSLSAAPPDPPCVTRIDTVRQGDTFSSLLLRNHLYVRDVERYTRAARRSGLFSLRRMLPGETVAIRVDAGGVLRHLEYRKGPDRVYVLEETGDSLNVYRTGLPYDTYLRRLGGVVQTTVDEVLRGLGADGGVVLNLAEIFASQIDFLTEPRVGDRIVLLVEEKRYQGERVGIGPIHYAAYLGKRVRQTAVRYAVDGAPEGTGAYYTPAGVSLTRTFLRSPLNYRRISSRFARRRFHPILRIWRPHLGIDYAAPPGTPVVAVGKGTVNLAGWNGNFGRQVRIRHGENYETSYGHLSRIAPGLRRGQRVEKGQVIGYVGSSGLSTGPHLDFRVRHNGRYIDPLRMENPPAAPVPEGSHGHFLSRVAALEALVDSLAPGEVVGWPAPTSGLQPGEGPTATSWVPGGGR